MQTMSGSNMRLKEITWQVLFRWPKCWWMKRREFTLFGPKTTVILGPLQLEFFWEYTR